MNLYTFMSLEYDLLDVIWFREKGINPRDVIQNIIPDESCMILDMCCGTLSNGISIARCKPECRIIGIDRSSEMLREARRKIKKNNLQNIEVIEADATASQMEEKSFDYIVIGLVLHECSPELRDGILKEARRLLKDDGKLIILEWEKEDRKMRAVKYAPLYALEVLNCRDFKEFYNCDKTEYFNKHGFSMINQTHCNYSSVMVLNKNR